MPRDIEALRAFLKTRYREDKYIERLFYPESPLPLEDCYLSLALVTEEEVRKAKGLQAGEADSGEGAAAVEAGTQERQHCLHEYDRIQHIQKKLDVNAILGECQHTPGRIPRRIYIEGAAGAGKSTLSRFLAHEWGCDKAPWSGEYDWVFHLRLRDLTLDKYAQEKDLFDILDGELFVGDGSHLTPEELTVFQGDVREHPSKVLWILDGYDEVNPGILGSRWWRGLLASQYHLLITSRPGTALVKREVGINLELAVLGLSDDQVKEYIQNFFDPIHTPDAKPSDAKVCFDFLKAQVELWSLAHTPILLEILCSSWQELRAQPILTLTHLYEVVVERLLKRRARAEGIAAEALSREFLETRYKSYLSYMEHLAFLGMLSRSPIIQKENIEESFKALPSELKQDKDFYKNLRDLGVVKRYNDGLRAEFAHLTFQEFFAARYVAKSIIAFSEKKKRVGYLTDEALLKFFKQNKWHEFYEVMWWFVAGLLRNGTNQSVLEKYAYHGGDRNHTELGELPHSHRCLQATQVFFDLLLQEPRAELEVFELPLLAKCLVEAGMPNVMQREAIKLHFIRWLEFSLSRKEPVLKTDISQKIFSIVKTNPEIIRWIEFLLLSKLKDPDKDLRAVAAEAVGAIGASASEALQAGLLLLLRDPKKSVREAAVVAVVDMGSGVSEALQALIRDPETDVRSLVLGTLAGVVGKMGASVSEDLQLRLLPSLLRDPDRTVRCAAVKAVGEIGSDANEDLKAELLLLLRDPEWRVCEAVVDAVRKIGDSASEALQAEFLQCRRAASECRAVAVGAGASEALQLSLLPLLHDSDDSVRWKVINALSKTRSGSIFLYKELFRDRPRYIPPCRLIISTTDRVGVDEAGRLDSLKLCGTILQSVLSDGDRYTLTENHWAIAIVRKKEAADAQRPRSSVSFFGSARDFMSHTFLVIEGVQDQVRFAYKIDLHAVGSQASQSSGQNIKIEITEIDDFKRFEGLSKNSCCMVHGISKEAATSLFDDHIQMDQVRAEQGEILYNIAGDGSINVRANNKPTHSCISWCLEKWQEAGLPLKRKWYDTVAVLPTAYLPDRQEQAKKDCLMM